jgi:hypothetical protein
VGFAKGNLFFPSGGIRMDAYFQWLRERRLAELQGSSGADPPRQPGLSELGFLTPFVVSPFFPFVHGPGYRAALAPPALSNFSCCLSIL